MGLSRVSLSAYEMQCNAILSPNDPACLLSSDSPPLSKNGGKKPFPPMIMSETLGCSMPKRKLTS